MGGTSTAVSANNRFIKIRTTVMGALTADVQELQLLESRQDFGKQPGCPGAKPVAYVRTDACFVREGVQVRSEISAGKGRRNDGI